MYRHTLKTVATLWVSSIFVLSISGCKEDPVLAGGKDVFSKYCATCHQQDGQGVEGAFPSLHRSEWIGGDPGRLIRLALRGMQGPIVVNGKTYNNVMTPHGFLTDEQLASVLTFVRQEFGNRADAISTVQVALVRASLTSDDLYVASELEGIVGIPEAPEVLDE